jgi:hypothetical protein
VTCIRTLQRLAGRYGRQLAHEYERHGETKFAQELRSLETATLRRIDEAHRAGPCQCAECRVELGRTGT